MQVAMNIYKDKFDYSLTIYNRSAASINNHNVMDFKRVMPIYTKPRCQTSMFSYMFVIYLGLNHNNLLVLCRDIFWMVVVL